MKTVNIKFGDEIEMKVDKNLEEEPNDDTTIMDLSFDGGSSFLASLINASSVITVRMQNIDYKYK